MIRRLNNDGRRAAEIIVLVMVEIETQLGPGDHQIAVDAKGVDGPSAFFLELELRFDDKTRQSIVSDAAWRNDGSGVSFPRQMSRV